MYQSLMSDTQITLQKKKKKKIIIIIMKSARSMVKKGSGIIKTCLLANDLEQLSQGKGFSLVSIQQKESIRFMRIILSNNNQKKKKAKARKTGLRIRVRRCRWRCSSRAKSLPQNSHVRDFPCELAGFFFGFPGEFLSSPTMTGKNCPFWVREAIGEGGEKGLRFEFWEV